MSTAELQLNELSQRTLTYHPPLRHFRRENSASVYGGSRGGSSVRRPVSEDPYRRQWNFLFLFFLCHILFSQKGLSQGYGILHEVLSQKKEEDKELKEISIFQYFSPCAREKPTRTCAWGFHEHTTIAFELIKLENTYLPSPPWTRAPEKHLYCRLGGQRRVKRAQTYERGPKKELSQGSKILHGLLTGEKQNSGKKIKFRTPPPVATWRAIFRVFRFIWKIFEGVPLFSQF